MAHRGPYYKVVLLGELGVGKSSIFRRLRDDTFDERQPATTGIDSCTALFKVENENVMLTIWDTAGVERFRTLTRNYYRNAHAAVFLYSVSEASSLHYLTQWVKDCENFAPSAVRMLIGNKSDLDAEVDFATAKSFANLYEFIGVHILSAKKNLGIQEAFQDLANKLHAPQTQSPVATPSLPPSRSQPETSKKCCK